MPPVGSARRCRELSRTRHAPSGFRCRPVNEISALVGLSPIKIDRIRSAAEAATSLDRQFEDSTVTRVETIADIPAATPFDTVDARPAHVDRGMLLARGLQGVQRVHPAGCRHRQACMARVRALDGVHAEHADRVDLEPIHVGLLDAGSLRLVPGTTVLRTTPPLRRRVVAVERRRGCASRRRQAR